MGSLSYSKIRAIVLSLALVLRVLVVGLAREKVPPTADGHFYHVVAQRIAEGHGYTWLWPDGAITAAAHYPVGYPALMSIPYGLFGYEPLGPMLINGFFGFLMTWAVLELSLFSVMSKRAASSFSELRKCERLWLLGVGLLAAGLPSLIFYTPALMTEGVVSALLIISLLSAVKFRRYNLGSRRAFYWLLTLFVSLVGATYLRPQTIALVPVFGFVLSRSAIHRRLLYAIGVTVVVLLCCLPWTFRNCAQMGQCVFISANGGWNLLIGTFSEGQGAWLALEGERVPLSCSNVFAEAAKDSCFGRAGVQRILEEPFEWLALVPQKMAATFDYSNLAAGHLAEAGAIDGKSYSILSLFEITSNRIVLLALLCRIIFSEIQATAFVLRVRVALLVVGILGVVGFGVIWTLLAALIGMTLNRRLWQDEPLLVFTWSCAVTILIHSVFFGASRYGLPIIALALPSLASLSSLSFRPILKGMPFAFDTQPRSR